MSTNESNITQGNVFSAELRDLWNQYILIQEQLLKKRCAPIYIDPKTILIDGNKFTADVDDEYKERQVFNILRNRLQIRPEEDIMQDSILVDEKVWKSLSEAEISDIQKQLASFYIELGSNDVIQAVINYDAGNQVSNFLTLEDITKTDKVLRSENKGAIDDIAACIVTLNVDVELFCFYLFGENHYSRKITEKKGKQVYKDVIQYKNYYIPKETIEKYDSIGLRLSEYRITFKISNKKALNEMFRRCDLYNCSDGTFVFKRSFGRKEQFSQKTLEEIQQNLHTFITEARHYCSETEISYDVEFFYKVSNYNIVQHIFKSVQEYVERHEKISFSAETGTLGIDFNWREDNIGKIIKIITDLETAIPFVEAGYYGEEHKFKCKIATSMVGFEQLKSSLEERFQNVEVLDDQEEHCVRINLPCQAIEYYDKLQAVLQKELNLLVHAYPVTIYPRISGKVRIPIKDNKESRIENIEESLKELRKTDFGFDIGGVTVTFGKLLSVRYPKLTFDVNMQQSDKENDIRTYLHEKTVHYVVPVLTGDIEKIARLKNAFSMATDGVSLLNSNMQNFLFDSHYATATDDIETILRRDGGPYNDLCKHLLNAKINESQKDAILKCVFAKDMAVIQGPPGSGKSTAIAELIWQLIRFGLEPGNKKERILLTSETNLAVDNAISRIINSKTNIVKPIRFGGEDKLEAEGLQFSYELMKKWVENGDDALLVYDSDDEDEPLMAKSDFIFNNWLSNISDRAFYGTFYDDNEIMVRWKRVLQKPDKEIREKIFNRYIEGCNVVGATCSSIGEKRSIGKGATQFFRYYNEIFKPKGRNQKIKFTTVIQDESSKATPAELVLPFVYGQKAIVIGDHRQLPPMLDREEMESSLEYAQSISKTKEETTKIVQLLQFLNTQFDKIEESHFQRLYENIDPSLKETFNLQYRMHPDINDVIKQFYIQDGGLNCGLITPIDLGVNDNNFSNPASRYHGLDIPHLISPNTHVLFVNTHDPEMLDGTSRVNYGEVEVIDKLLEMFETSDSFSKFLSRFEKDEDRQIGIISFYGKQIRLLRSLAGKHKNLPIRVSTVDRFQGMERNIIIVSMVRSHIIESSVAERPNFKRYKYGYPEQHSLGFAQSPNRLNVALSRAKRLLVIVGNETLFSRHPIYSNLFKTIRSNPNNIVINQEQL